MAFVAVATSVGATVLGTGAAAGIGSTLVGGALLGAGAGGLYSAVTGDGNVLNSMLTGGLIGGAVGGIGGALFPGAAGYATPSLTTTGASLGANTAIAPSATSIAGTANTPALASSALNAAPFDAAGYSGALNQVPAVAPVVQGAAPVATSNLIGAAEAADAAGYGGMTNGVLNQVPGAVYSPVPNPINTAAGLTGKEMLGYGLAGTAALSLLGGMNQKKLTAGQYPGQAPSQIRPYTYSATQTGTPSGVTYGANGLPILPTSEQNYFTQKYTAGTPYNAAAGGLMAAGGPVERMSQNVMGGQGNMFPQSQQEHTNFATPTQMPVSAEIIRSDYDTKTNPYTGVMMADGGITYDAATQTYKGLPTMGNAPVDVPQLPAELVSQLTPQWQAANPNAFSYDAKLQRYGAGNPTMAQLNAFKAEQDRKAAEEAAALRGYSSYGGEPAGANGGLMPYNLGGYSDGGRLLKGPGDGVSDDIPATIGDKQPARLADGEFVIPARIVSELGNGSTDAGAKRLYAMMDRIQAGRKKTVGKDKVAVNSKAEKHLPA